jgi:hypothetical protein
MDVDGMRSSPRYIGLWFTASGRFFVASEAIKLKNIVAAESDIVIFGGLSALLTQVEQALPCGCGPSSPVLHQVAAITLCTHFLSTVFELEFLSLFQ